jgi:tRNA threonylcarbamoyladenosine biosynthesis protein TsaE
VTPAAGALTPVELRTQSAEGTRRLGACLARGLRAGDVVLLSGELGSGKTTLAQGIAAGLGVADIVTSPTFTLVRSYPCPVPPVADGLSAADGLSPGPGPAVRTFIHADLYRLDHTGEVADLALGELVEEAAVAVVEWGNVAGPALGGDSLSVLLAQGDDDDERRVTVTVPMSWGPRRDELAEVLSQWATP